MSEATPVARQEPLHPRPPTPVGTDAKKKRSDVGARLLTATILIPLVIYATFTGGLLYLAVVTALIALGQREVYGLIEDKGAHPLVGFGIAAGAALPIVAYLGTEYHATILLTATLLAVMILQLGKAQITEALASMSGTFFGVFYVGWLMSHAIPLRNFHAAVASRLGPGVADQLSIAPDSGIFFMLLAMVVVVASDAGAYFAGRAYGKRKLAPKVSPSKTIEGTIGGVLFAIFCGCVTKAIFDFLWPHRSAYLDYETLAVLALFVAAAGIVGDLVESLLKRDAAVKDAGRLLPGMGGVLDRIDSALLGIPVMYYLLLFTVWLQVD